MLDVPVRTPTSLKRSVGEVGAGDISSSPASQEDSAVFDGGFCVSYTKLMAVTSVQFALATHIMAVLGFSYGTELTTAALAGSVNAEPTFVRKSVSKLVKAGLVKATRGKLGACTLARPPEEITLWDIYVASEAPAPVAGHLYPVEESCPISMNFKGCMSLIQCAVQESLEVALSKTTLASLVADLRERMNG